MRSLDDDDDVNIDACTCSISFGKLRFYVVIDVDAVDANAAIVIVGFILFMYMIWWVLQSN